MNKELPWSITITKAQNGFILSYDEELISDHPGYTTKQIVVEEKENKLDAVEYVLHEVLDRFGIYEGITIAVKGDEE